MRHAVPTILLTSILLAGCVGTSFNKDPIVFSAEETTPKNQFFDAGYIYENGIGVTKSYSKAQHFYLLAIKTHNDQRAMNNLGVMHLASYGKSSSTYQGVSYLKKAAKNGSSTAAFNLAKLYLDGTIVSKDNKAGFKYLNEAARLGNEQAQAYLASELRSGQRTTKNAADAERLNGLSLLKASTARNDPPSRTLDIVAGLLREKCVECASIDDIERMARDGERQYLNAVNGDAVAQYNVANKLLDGSLGTDDIPEAVRMLMKSATQHYPPAMAQLASIYQTGSYLRADKERAYAWYSIAASSNHPVSKIAAADLEALTHIMSKREIESGQELSQKLGQSK